MAKFRIKVHVEFVECNDPINQEPTKNNDGSFSMTISKQDAISIDMCEKSVLQTAYPTIRDAVSSHLSEVSKKKASERSTEGQEVVPNSYPYRVDGEIGRFTFKTYSVFQGGQKTYNTARDLFICLQGVEFYKTIGFKDIAMIYGDTEQSYRKTAQLINRIRYQQQGGTPSRTLQECTEKEGSEILLQIKDKATNILTNEGFSKDGICQESKAEYANGNIATKPADQVAAAIERCRLENHTGDNISANPVPYENPESSVNVAIDDVIVKKQEETRESGKKSDRGKRKYVHNTIAHISKANEGSYVLNGHGIKNVLLFLTAFLFHNGLTGARIQFFTDGHKALNKAIYQSFSWYKNIGIILDWYHLEKKCKEHLSLSLKGRIIRNAILDELMPLLWNGSTDLAVVYLEGIAKDSIKNMVALEKLIAYLNRNKSYIPCYAVRKELGLSPIFARENRHRKNHWRREQIVQESTFHAVYSIFLLYVMALKKS